MKLVDFGIRFWRAQSPQRAHADAFERGAIPDATSAGVLVARWPTWRRSCMWVPRTAKIRRISLVLACWPELITTKMPYKNPAIRAMQHEELPVPAELRSCPELDPALTEIL